LCRPPKACTAVIIRSIHSIRMTWQPSTPLVAFPFPPPSLLFLPDVNNMRHLDTCYVRHLRCAAHTVQNSFSPAVPRLQPPLHFPHPQPFPPVVGAGVFEGMSRASFALWGIHFPKMAMMHGINCRDLAFRALWFMRQGTPKSPMAHQCSKTLFCGHCGALDTSTQNSKDISIF
jgi:hypothetical protein